jgi:hypothetical protein
VVGKYVEVDEQLVAKFESLLSDPDQDENALQRFIERHTEFIPTPSLLNHFLHFNCIISKFKIGAWSSDLAYLTKCTPFWRLVLVELEHPRKSIFKDSSNYEGFTAEFNEAIAQINTWRDILDKNPTEIKRRLAPLQAHMRDNPIEFSYLLVIGRDAELRNHQRRTDRLAGFRSRDIQVMTWDSLIRIAQSGRAERKCLLSETATGFKVKFMHAFPQRIFAYLPPSQLEIDEADVARLQADGYRMDMWKAGDLLVMNERYPEPENMGEAIADMLLAAKQEP